MIIRLVVVLGLLVLAACGGSGGSDAAPPPVTTPPPPTQSTSEKLAAELVGLSLTDFYDQSFEAISYRSPEGIIWSSLTSLYPLDDATLDTFTEAYQRETYAIYNVVLNALRTYDKAALSADDQLTYDFYEWWLQDAYDRLAFIYYDFVATYNFAGVQNTTQRFFTDIHPMATKQDAEDFVARLGDVARKFLEIESHLVMQSGAGIIEPRLTLDVAIAGLRANADDPVDRNAYYQVFESKLSTIPGLDNSERQELLTAARNAVSTSVIPAHQSLRTRLQTLRANAPNAIGVGQYPNGSEYYNYLLRHRTTTNLTAAEIHQLGLDELVRIHAEMRTIFDQLGYPQNETLAQLYGRVATDGGIVEAADVKSTYESIVAAAEVDLTEAFDLFPSANVVVGEDAFGGFYIAPSFDGTRPGTFFAGTQTSQPWFQMPSLSYHEAVPGHHTQIAIAMDLDTVPFRQVLRFTAFSEGWALYAERLAFELGWYDSDPYGDLGRLQYEALRAARLVIDTGIHSLGWSFEQAVQFNQANVGASRGSSEGAAGRYSVVPAQATAYMVGMLRILDARQRAMDQLGADFDLKEFHRIVLQSGGIPMALLDGVVDRYIAEKLATR